MCSTEGIVLYGNPRSRSVIVDWQLRELGLKYETRSVDMQNKEHKADAYLKINPFGKLPALQDGEVTLCESGAIVMYLADKYGGMDTAAKRANVAKWVLFANSSLDKMLFSAEARAKEMPSLLQPVEALLSKQPFLLGDDFSAADVAVGSYLLYAVYFDKDVDLSPYPKTQEYMKRLEAREHCTLKPQPTA